MADTGLIHGLSYTLCAFAGLSLLLSVTMAILTAVHKQLKKDTTLRYVRYGQLLTAVANITAGIGVVLVMVWTKLQDHILCEAGGYLMIFGVLESVWMLLITSVCLLIQMKAKVKGEGHMVRLRRRWSFPIFLLTVLLKAVILAMIVFLALTKIQFFNTWSLSCEMIRLYGAGSWQYSVVLITLAWLAVIPATIVSLCNLFLHGANHYTVCKNRNTTTPDKFTRWVALGYLTSALLWIIVLMAFTVIIFSGSDFIIADHVNLALGYAFILALILATVVMIVVLVLSRRWSHYGTGDKSSREVLLSGEPPGSLVSLTKLPIQKDDVHRYQVQWLDHQRMLISGVMKVYHPACVARWRCEVNAVAKVTASNHPNIAMYLWESSRNKFAPAICTFTGDLLSPESSIACMQHYPHGTLGGYLKTRSHMTEVGLHKVTLDVARGLGFIHQNHLVHNSLTTETIYMASVAGTIGLRAVIGDFDNSYEVSENTLRKSPLMVNRSHILDNCSFGSLYSISQQMDLDNNKFAPDIRSFGMIVLEMLMALGEFDEHSAMGVHYRSRDARRNSTYDNTSLGSAQSQPLVRRQVLPQMVVARQHGRLGSDSNIHDKHQHGSKDCKCSPRVTDIRAVKCRSMDGTPIQVIEYPDRNHASSSVDEITLCKSAFASVKSQKNSENTPPKPVSVRSNAGQISPRRIRSHIQNRDLPPVPPRSLKSPRRYRSANQRPAHDITKRVELSPRARDREVIRPETPLSMALNEMTNSHSNEACDYSPTSDQDGRSLSIGSLGSFETIYEDDERSASKRHQGAVPAQNSSLTKPGRVLATKPPVLKRKIAEFDQQRKRYSVTSVNDSVFSIDSGIGSYASDTYSDTYGQRTWRDIQRGRRGIDSPDMASLLRVHKQPCNKYHPEPGHSCNHSCSSEPSNSCSDHGYSNSSQTDSSTSNTDTMSSEEPTYESIPSPKRGSAAKRPRELKVSPVEGIQFPMKDLISGPHPAIRQQYRFAVPRLGISAVLNRRLSDASLSSLTSCSTHRSHDLTGSSENITTRSKSQPGGAMSRPNSSSKTRPGSANQIKDPVDSRTPDAETPSLSSSILSIIQDSKLLLDSTQHSHIPPIPSHLPPIPSHLPPIPKAKPASHRTQLGTKGRARAPELQDLSKMLDCVSLEQKDKGRMLNMLKLISGNDKLGIIGHQLMTLFSDCWLEEPVPSADELFQRLNLVLPSASV